MRISNPKPIHVPGTSKGEETVMKKGREAGRGEAGSKYYQSARDSTAVNADSRRPIDPRMPNMPPA